MRDSPFPSSSSVAGAGLLTVSVIALLGFLRWLELPIGEWGDWVVGIAAFWWLLGVTTIPWNVHFGARRVLLDIKVSQERGIHTSETSERTAQKIAKNALIAAISLHLATAAGFAALAHFGLSQLGWMAAIAALLLTFVQPLARFYQHLVQALRNMSEEARYPRDDVQTLRAEISDIQQTLRQLDQSDIHSWSSTVERRLASTTLSCEKLDVAIQDTRRELRQSTSQLTEDTQFLGNVRELLRFIKDA